MKEKILIVGTGLGGLASGLRLATRGYQVVFVEKANTPGGRLNILEKEGFRFDTGPSFFSMPYEFEELMNDCGLPMPFEFIELDPLYTVHFSGSDKKFFLYKDLDKLSEQFENIEPNFKEKFNLYLNKSSELYNDTVNVVIKQNFDNILDYLKALMKVNPKHLPVLFKNFWQQVGKYFESKEARQIISLVAFFLGRTPFDTNAIYTLLSHIEFRHSGYYNVTGGMYTIVESLMNLLKNYNVEFNFQTEIVDYYSNGDNLEYLIDKNGKKWQADIYLINADAAFFRGQVFKREKYNNKHLNKMNWTMGYLTFYLGIDIKLPQIEHHNYFIGSNYQQYSKQVMTDPGTIEKPYYYVNVISRNNPKCAPDGCEALFFVCPVPNLIYKNNWQDKDQIIDSIIVDFSERIKQNISPHIIVREVFSPEDWRDKFNLYQGAGLGLSHKMNQIGAFRPANFDEIFQNTFYVGSSTLPGAGLPMVVISSKLATERIFNYINKNKKL
jgi:phytoene desaturase